MGLLCLIALPASAATPTAPELLFRVSADRDLQADVARGDGVPNFRDKITLVPTGKRGNAIEWADDGVLSWNAPGNLYTQRGTLGFFWRARYAVGEAPFVIFRVGYADHTSWDMAWLRIDWNGHGFDAFVTDANLARTRVSFKLDKNPAASDWTHIAFAWDESAACACMWTARKPHAWTAVRPVPTAARSTSTPRSTSSAWPAG